MNIVAKENTEKGYFFKNNYYYINAERTNINRVNLSTLKVTSVRGKKEKGKSKLYYDKLFISDKKMFYAVSSGKGASRGEAPSKIYSYEEGNKDKKIYTASINMMDSVCGNQNIGIVDFGIKKNEIIIYNVKTDKKESHQIPNEVAQVYMMMGNLIFCNDSAESDAYRIVRL
ncbi:MAG: hypothetical protein PHD70_14125 [Anaerostipes sp.]|nr:hypothetical protein [Anaerostipes sp.]MDD3747595.1 hypothetical protein [Anaerostipes sp.]